jgi:hypothetical protein
MKVAITKYTRIKTLSNSCRKIITKEKRGRVSKELRALRKALKLGVKRGEKTILRNL